MPARPFPPPLELATFQHDVVEVAPALLGALLIRVTTEGTTIGRIVETEAYLASGDSACHAARGQTPRNAAMFGPAGRAYVYAIHSRWCFNVVTQSEQVPSAVLIRAVEPLQGIELMQTRRGRDKLLALARGPARLCEAFAIDRTLNHLDLTLGSQLWLSAGDQEISEEQIGISVRIGVTSAKELPLRFFLRDNRFVSGKRIN